MKLEISTTENKVSIKNRQSYNLGEGIVTSINKDFEKVNELLRQALTETLYQQAKSIQTVKDKITKLHPALSDEVFLLQTLSRFTFNFLRWVTCCYSANRGKRQKPVPLECDKLDYLFEIRNDRFIISESSYEHIFSKLRPKGLKHFWVDFKTFDHKEYVDKLDYIDISDIPTLFDKFTMKDLKELIGLVFLKSEDLSKLSTMQRYCLYCQHHAPLELSGTIQYKADTDNQNDLPHDLSKCAEILQNKKIYYSEQYAIETLSDMVILEIIKMVNGEIKINQCENCGMYFLPTKRADEIYCNNVYKNNRTCRELGYENKLRSDELLKAYRKAYKAKNIWKNRNIHNPKAVEHYNNWYVHAKKQLALAQADKITLDEFIESIKDVKKGD